MGRIILMFLIIGVIVTGIVWLIDKFLKPKWLKYILVSLFVILTIYLLIEAKNGSGEGFKDLANFLLAMFTFAGAASSLTTSIVLDVIRKNKNK